jgi:hypothetical protein
MWASVCWCVDLMFLRYWLDVSMFWCVDDCVDVLISVVCVDGLCVDDCVSWWLCWCVLLCWGVGCLLKAYMLEVLRFSPENFGVFSERSKLKKLWRFCSSESNFEIDRQMRHSPKVDRHQDFDLKNVQGAPDQASCCTLKKHHNGHLNRAVYYFVSLTCLWSSCRPSTRLCVNALWDSNCTSKLHAW